MKKIKLAFDVVDGPITHKKGTVISTNAETAAALIAAGHIAMPDEAKDRKNPALYTTDSCLPDQPKAEPPVAKPAK